MVIRNLIEFAVIAAVWIASQKLIIPGLIPAIAVPILIATPFQRVVPHAIEWGVAVGLILEILSYIHLRLTIWKVAALHPGECWPELLKTHQFRYFDGLKNRRTARLEDDSCWEEDEAG